MGVKVRDVQMERRHCPLAWKKCRARDINDQLIIRYFSVAYMYLKTTIGHAHPDFILTQLHSFMRMKQEVVRLVRKDAVY